MYISSECFLLFFMVLAVVLLPPLHYPLGCEANSLSLNSGLRTWPALRSVAVEQSGQIGFPRVNWLCWISLCSNPVLSSCPVEQEGWGLMSKQGKLLSAWWLQEPPCPDFVVPTVAGPCCCAGAPPPRLPACPPWNIVLLPAAAREGPPWRSFACLALGCMVGLWPKVMSLHIKGSIVLPLPPSKKLHCKPDALCEKPFLLKKDVWWGCKRCFKLENVMVELFAAFPPKGRCCGISLSDNLNDSN